jgi:hypothetical protein
LGGLGLLALRGCCCHRCKEAAGLDLSLRLLLLLLLLLRWLR